MNLPIKRFDFSSGVSSVARPSMIPAAAGEYCLYSEACAAVAGALDAMTKPVESPYLHPRVTCGKRIPLDPDGRANTYCMSVIGHEGECK